MANDFPPIPDIPPIEDIPPITDIPPVEETQVNPPLNAQEVYRDEQKKILLRFLNRELDTDDCLAELDWLRLSVQ